MEYKDITFKENQEHAFKLLKYYGYLDEKIPIDPENILREMDIDIIPIEDLFRKYRIKGFVAKYKGQFQVFIDKKHYYAETSSSLFTLGEELGHIVLHLDECENITNITDWQKMLLENNEYYSFIENQARVFSSNIILPYFKFKDYALQWVATNKDSLIKRKSNTKEELAYHIGYYMQMDLGISSYIIEITLGRWPDRAIESICIDFPELIE